MLKLNTDSLRRDSREPSICASVHASSSVLWKWPKKRLSVVSQRAAGFYLQLKSSVCTSRDQLQTASVTERVSHFAIVATVMNIRHIIVEFKLLHDACQRLGLVHSETHPSIESIVTQNNECVSRACREPLIFVCMHDLLLFLGWNSENICTFYKNLAAWNPFPDAFLQVFASHLSLFCKSMYTH